MVSIKCSLKHQILTQYLFLKKTLQKLISEMNYLCVILFLTVTTQGLCYLFYGSN